MTSLNSDSTHATHSNETHSAVNATAAATKSIKTKSIKTKASKTKDAETKAMKPRKKRKALTGHRIAFLIHSFVGLKLTLIFSLILISGTLAVFSEEIDWLLYSEVRVTPKGEKLQEGELFDRMNAAMPGVGLSFFNTSVDRDRTAAQALMTDPEGGFKKVWIDPYTGEINGITDFLTVGEFIALLHGNLFLPVIGRAFVNVFGVFCLIMAVTGLIYYKKFWKGFFKLPRFNAKARVFWADLHKFVGLWSLWFVLIMGITGSWWFYFNPLVMYDLAPSPMPERVIDPSLTNENLEQLGAGIPNRLSAREIVDAVKAHDPDLVIHSLTPPEHNGMAYVVSGTKFELLTNKWDSRYFVHPFTGEVIGDRLAQDFPGIIRFSRAMKPLHYGTFGWEGAADLLVKAIWFVFGIAMSVLSISGMIIYYRRTKRATEKLLPSSNLARKAKKSWWLLRPWGGSMGVFKYLNILFIIAMCIGISIGFKLQSEGTSGSGYLYKTQTIGPWSASLNATRGLLEKDLDPIGPSIRTNFNIFIRSGDPNAIKFMYVKTRKPRTNRAPGFVIHGPVGHQHAHFRLPKTLKENSRLWLTIEDWDGNFYRTSWSLMPDGDMTIDLRTASPE